MTIEDYIRFGSALVLVLATMGILAMIVRKLNGMQGGGFMGRQTRLNVIELRVIDSRTKMVLVRRDTVEHLVLVSNSGQTVVETGIIPPAEPVKPKNKKDIPVEI